MKCPNCGVESPAGVKFCQECGTALPSVKLCIKCGRELPANTKFCPECGTNQNQVDEAAGTSGLAMGDKNVIAGDVVSNVNNNQQVHHNENINTTTTNTTVNNTTNNTTNTTTNTTNINYRDDTKESCLCSLCGKHTIKTEGYTCTSCGEFVCANDFNASYKVCKKCSGEHVKSNGKISSFKVFKDKYTEIEASKPNKSMNILTSMYSIDNSDTKLVTLIQNYEIQENYDEIIKFINFANIKINGRYNVAAAMTNPLGGQGITQAFKDKIQEAIAIAQTMGLDPSQLKSINSVSRKQYTKSNRNIIRIVISIPLFFLFLYILSKIMPAIMPYAH